MRQKNLGFAGIIIGGLCAMAHPSFALAQDASSPDTQQTASRAALQAELNLASVEDISGAELGIGVRFSRGSLYLAPGIGGFIYDDPSAVFRRETLSNGREICRDRRNGRFADDENCSPAVDVYGRLEAGVNVSSGLSLGVGVRVGDETIPYGRLAVSLGDTLDLQGMAGDGYSAIGLALRF